MGRSIDLVGKHYGRLVVIEKTDKRTNDGTIIWKCQCDCGNIKEVSTSSLNKGYTKSCGCLNNDTRSKMTLMRNMQNSMKPGDECNGFKILETELRQTCSNNHREMWALAICPYCGSQKWIRASFIRNSNTKSCGCITRSAGESKISLLLKEANISFEKEKTFPDLKFGKKYARFDFYIPDKNYLIEYDGQQHFIPSRFQNHITEEEAKERLIITQQYDAIKNKYCVNNNIPLIRIPYTQYNNLCLEDLLLETTKFLYNPDKEEVQ